VTDRERWDVRGAVRRMEALTFSGSGGFALIRRHEYDGDSRLVRIVERLRNGRERVSETYEYGAAGTRTKIVAVDAAGTRAAVTAWAVEGSDAFYSAPGTASVKTVYDASGRRVETVSSVFGPLGRERQTMAYNARGDCVEDICEGEDRRMNFDAEGRLADDPSGATTSRSEARIDYEYDERGNWIRKAVLARHAPDRDFVASSVEQRTIAYYD
jgi:hypothetical protein